MFGVEIAGLVLGGLPILIAALEQYKKGSRPVETFLWKWKKQLETLMRCLKHHRVLFRQNMRRLLAAASLPEETELAKQDDIFDVMQKPDVCRAVEQYLDDGECLEFFIEVLEECKQHLEQIAGNLQHIRRPGKSDPNLHQVIQANPAQNEAFSFKERFNFTMKHKEMKSLVEQIDKCNDKLEKFLDSVDKINKIKAESPIGRPSGSAKLLAASFHRIWKHANSLHSAVATYWPEPCDPSHQAMLFLETRAGIPHATNKHQNPKFRLLFAIETSSITNQAWSESEIHVHDVTLPSTATKSEVQDLCAYVTHSSVPDKACMMDLTEEEKLYHRHRPSCDAWVLRSSNLSPITLGQHLRGDKIVPLMPKDITILALTLASSLLQLTQTKWVGQTWTKDVIQFFQSQQASKEVIEWTRPLITTSFPSTGTNSRSVGVKEDLLDLGIVLLEIWEQQSFESWLKSVGMIYVDEYYVKMAFAIRWLESVQERWPLSYADAVSACVRFSFEGVTHRWDHPEFRRAVCEKVVAPLQQNCTAWVRFPVS